MASHRFLAPLGPWTGRCDYGDHLGVEGRLCDIRWQLLAAPATWRAGTVSLSILRDEATAERARLEALVPVPGHELGALAARRWRVNLLSLFYLEPAFWRWCA